MRDPDSKTTAAARAANPQPGRRPSHPGWPCATTLLLTMLGVACSRADVTQSVFVPAGATTIADHLHFGSNTLQQVLPNVAPGTMVVKYHAASSNYLQQVFNPPLGWQPNPNETLAPGEGAWIVSPLPQTLNFFGLPQPPTPRPRLPAGRYFVSSPAPQPAGFEELMGFPPIIGDRVIQYNGVYPTVPQPPNQASSVHTFGPGGWDLVPIVPMGKSAFVELAAGGASNAPPQLDPIFTQVLHAGTLLQVPVHATDPDQTNQLTFSLEPGAPLGMSIDPVSGFLLWPTTLEDANQQLAVTVRVTDNGTPPLSDTRTFDIVITGLPEMLGIHHAAQQVVLAWSAIPGTPYRLLSATNLLGPWVESPQDIVATNTLMTVTDHATTSQQEKYYRVTTVPQVPTTTTNPWSWGYCLLAKGVVGGPGITVTPLAPTAGTSATAVNEAIPFIVNAGDLDQLVHYCVCIQPLGICAKGQVLNIQDTVSYQWSVVSGGGSLSADGPATLYQPPSLTNGEVRLVTLKVEITDSRNNDVKASVTYALELTRLGECSYQRKVTITPSTHPGAPVSAGGACDCEPQPPTWLVNPVLAGAAEKTVIACAGERVILHANGADSDTLKLDCLSGACGTSTSASVLVDEINYTWSATRGGFPDYGGSPTSNSRRTTVIYRAPDTAGDDTVTVRIRDSGAQAADQPLTNTIQIKVVKITDVNREASDTNTHRIASVQTAPCAPKLHFVTVKASNDMMLQVTVAPDDAATRNLITWERADGGAITSPVEGDRTKAKLSRNEEGKKIPIRIKVGDKTCREVVVWIIWATGAITRQPAVQFARAPDTTIDGTATTSAVVRPSSNYLFKFTIKPPEIITDPDRPDLSGAKAGGPPGGNSPFTGNLLSGGADKKWDITRRAQYRILNPNLIPKGKFSSGCGTIYDGQPQTNSLGADFPTNPVVGNDDSSVGDEANDPYNASAHAELGHAKGEVTSLDGPTIWMPEAGGRQRRYL